MGKYIIEVDESEIVECWNEQATKELGYQEYALKQCPKIKVKPYNPTGDCISREDLKEDFKSRLALCNEWIEKAKDKETKIRASAVKSYIAEVIMTIDNAPTVDIKDELAGAYNEGYMCGSREAEKARPQGEWIPVNPDCRGYPEYFKCSICGAYIYPSGAEKELDYNGCPYCFADMRKEK